MSLQCQSPALSQPASHFPPPYLASVEPVPSGRKVGLGALASYGYRAGSFPGLLLTPVPKAESSSVPLPPLRAFIPHPIPCWALDPLPSPLLAGMLALGPSLSLSDPASARRALSSTPSCSTPRQPTPGLSALQSLTSRGEKQGWGGGVEG